jgi:hypothetical protein
MLRFLDQAIGVELRQACLKMAPEIGFVTEEIFVDQLAQLAVGRLKVFGEIRIVGRHLMIAIKAVADNV